MNAELSRRLGQVLGKRPNSPSERRAIVSAAQAVETWSELPPDVQRLVDEIARRNKHRGRDADEA